MIASLVLGIAVSGLAVSLAASHQNSAEANDRGNIVQFGRALVEELAAKAFTSPNIPDKLGWSQGQTNRLQYDDVFDYNGYTDRVLISDSSIVVGSSTEPGYVRSVAVTPMLTTAQQAGSKRSARFARIRVTITPPSGDATTFEYWASKTSWRKNG
jgi:hypothetical protein